MVMDPENPPPPHPHRPRRPAVAAGDEPSTVEPGRESAQLVAPAQGSVRKRPSNSSGVATVTGVLVRPVLVHVVRSDLGPDDDELEPGNDRAAIAAWLNEFKDRPNTLRSYVREASRFWLWMSGEARDVTLASLKRRDLDAYMEFLAAPPPRWLPPPKDPANPKRSDRIWTPLKADMTPASRRQTLVILQSMLAWLREAGYVSRNPAMLIRNKGDVPPRKQRAVPPKEVVDLSLKMLRHDADALGDSLGRRESLMRRRDAFVYAWVYFTGARRHELAKATCSSVSLRRVGSSFSWWWRLVGKGAKEAHLPLAPQAVEVLAWYFGCDVAGLPDLLSTRGSTALIRPYRGTGAKIDPSQVYLNVVRASERIKTWAIDLELPELEPLGRARPHDLRACRTTHLLNAKVDPRHVQSLMRHTDFNTTLIYDHSINEDFHRAISAAS